MKARIVDYLFISPTKGRLSLDIEEDFRLGYDKLHDSDVEVTIEKKRPKRSKDANAYCWVLIYKIAEAVGEEPTMVYRKLIHRFPSKTKVCCVKEEDAESEIREFVEGHLGRMVDIGDSKIPGCVVLHKKYGSSSFDTAQMSAFVDKVLEQCSELGIEVRSAEYVSSLLKEWSRHE